MHQLLNDIQRDKLQRLVKMVEEENLKSIGMEWKDVVGYTATAVTIGLFLTGIDICKTIWDKKSTLGVSPLPFFTCCASCSLWICYGVGKQDYVLIVVNAVGLMLQICYLTFYYYMSSNKRETQLRLLALVASLLSLFMFAGLFWNDHDKTVSILGYMSSVASIVFMGSPLSQIALVIRTRSTESMPFPLISASFLMSSLWVYYGVLIEDYVVQIPNFIGACITALQLTLFAIYRGEKNLKTQFL